MTNLFIKKYFFWLLLIIIFLIRYFTTIPHFQNGQMLRISGYVFSEPSISFGSEKFNLSGIKVSAPTTLNIQYGDKVQLEGSYKDGVVTAKKVDELNSSTSIFIKIRNSLISFYTNSEGSLKGGLLAGIMTGTKSAIPAFLETRLKNSGTTYLITSSGIKISILSSFLMAILLYKFSRRISVILVISFIWIYTVILGFQVTTIKAAILATTALGSQIFGRVSNSLRNTLLAGFIMLIIFPGWLIDIGFLLSFSATISLILFQGRISKLFKFLPAVIAEDLATSIAAEIGTAPIIFFAFGKVNLLSPLINTLVIWTIPPIMLIGGISGIISFIFPELAKLILLPLVPLLVWFVSIVSL